jgi:DNA (cytosine-5)-methyltransferase 1
MLPLPKRKRHYSNASRNGKTCERRFISFFSGALGLDLGLHKGGLHSIAVNEFDAVACRTIRANLGSFFGHQQPRVYESDIRNLEPKMLCDDLGVKPRQLFAIVGGPHCQAFSTAGRRLGLNDDRGNVFLHFIDIILELQPKYAIFENVRGLLSAPMVHRPHSERGTSFAPLSELEKPGGALLYILRKLEEAGYKTSFNLYNTANFGVPQIRERLIFFASREGREIPDLIPTHDELGADGLPRWSTFSQAAASLDQKNCEAGRFPEKRLRFYRMLKEGQNWRNLPKELQQEAMGASWFAGGGKTGFYRRLAWNKPSPTLVTSPTMPATDLCHPRELRPLSVEEYKAIQTFPADYKVEGTLDEKYRQIGNAVPPLFGEKIAEHIIAFDEDRLNLQDRRRKLSRYVGTDHESWREQAESRQAELFA